MILAIGTVLFIIVMATILVLVSIWLSKKI